MQAVIQEEVRKTMCNSPTRNACASEEALSSRARVASVPNLVIATDFEHKGRIRLDPYEDSVGIVSGTFAPLHVGHMRVIAQSQADNFITIVIVGGYDHDRGALRGMPLKERYERLRCQFEDARTVYVAMVDELRKKDFEEEQGLQEFHDSVDEILARYIENPRCEYKVRNYVGQSDYADILSSSEIYSDHEIVLVDREDAEADTFGVQASDIDADPFGHWNEIADAFKCFYRKCIVLAGAESTGKTTMARELSRVFSSHRSREFGRVWTEGWRHRIESDLDEYDYLAFIAGQIAENENVLYAENDDKVVFLDTDGFVTSAYLQVDSAGMDAKMVTALQKVAHLSRKWTEKHADAVIVLPNDVAFEDDGSRDGHVEAIRDEYLDTLLDMLECWTYDTRNKTHLIKEGSFDEKLAECVQIVEGVLAE